MTGNFSRSYEPSRLMYFGVNNCKGKLSENRGVIGSNLAGSVFESCLQRCLTAMHTKDQASSCSDCTVWEEKESLLRQKCWCRVSTFSSHSFHHRHCFWDCLCCYLGPKAILNKQLLSNIFVKGSTAKVNSLLTKAPLWGGHFILKKSHRTSKSRPF